MKTFLRAGIIVSLLGLYSKAHSQPTNACHIKNVVVQNIVPVAPAASPDSCHVKLDISFNIAHNNGNKFIFMHCWIQSQYPNYFNCQGNYPPMGAVQAPEHPDLIHAFVNVGLNDRNTDPPTLLTEYPPDPSVPLNTAAWVEAHALPDGTVDIIVHQIDAVIPAPCGSQTTICCDVWASQAAQAQVVHCVCCSNCFSQGTLTAQGFANCGTLRWGATITNNSSATVSGVYQVYADVNGDGIFTASVDQPISASTPFSVNANAQITVTGNIPPANANEDLFLVITQSTGASTVVLLPSTVCAPLPVNFRSFTATRTNSDNVLLKWETATETNNSGFAVQMNQGNAWQTITFIPTQALNGNSSSVLSYSYNHANNVRGITQYRIRQVDIDGKAKYSEIRAVRGEGQKAKLVVYPNPSMNGTVNILFDETRAGHDVSVTDINGRTVKQWKAVMNNNLQVSDLTPGMYTVRVVDRETGEQSAQKIIISQR